MGPEWTGCGCCIQRGLSEQPETRHFDPGRIGPSDLTLAINPTVSPSPPVLSYSLWRFPRRGDNRKTCLIGPHRAASVNAQQPVDCRPGDADDDFRRPLRLKTRSSIASFFVKPREDHYAREKRTTKGERDLAPSSAAADFNRGQQITQVRNHQVSRFIIALFLFHDAPLICGRT